MMGWDEQADTEANARWAVWAEPDWDAGVAACVDALLDALTPTLEAGGRVLDVGCGVGRLMTPLAMRYPNATLIGLDPSPRMLSWASRSGLANQQFLQGDVETVRRHTSRFNGWYSVITFQHLLAEGQRAYITALADRMVWGGVGCFQIVTHADLGPRSNPVPVETAVGWCERVGLDVARIDDGRVNDEWAWITVIKKSVYI